MKQEIKWKRTGSETKISINEYLIQMSNIYLCIDSNKKGSEHNAKEAGTLQFNNVNSLVAQKRIAL